MPTAVESRKVPYYDITVIGAGFSGISSVYNARKRGLSIRVFDAQAGLGGTWYQNRYPGARVDTEVPMYELDIPEVYKDWAFSSRFPDWREIRKYFAHVDDVLDISKDVSYNTYITDASFDENTGLWTLETKDGPIAQSRIFMPLVGIVSTIYKPNFPGFEKFKGDVLHSAQWPVPGPENDDYNELKGRKIGLIGTGSTGVQIVQESGPRAKELYVFQRTPNMSLPMVQKHNYKVDKAEYPEKFAQRFVTPGGFGAPPYEKKFTDEPDPKKREEFYESLFKKGGFAFWVTNYADMMTNEEANNDAYSFWQRTVSRRIKDPKVAEILAPKKPPHPFGTKRPSLEQNYYDQYNRPNVHLIDINKNGIKEFYEDGVILQDGTKCEIDMLVLATGFDALNGSFKNFNIWNKDHTQTVSDYWNGPDGCTNFMGLACQGYPNMLFTFGPLAPTAFANGPSCIEFQTNYMFKVIDKLFSEGKKYFEPESEYEKAYRKRIDEYAATTLYPKAKSWYMGANIPGKNVQMLSFSEGLPAYNELIQQHIKNGFDGLTFY